MFSNRMDYNTLKLQALEHHVHRQLKPCLEGRGFLLLAVSGGLDSTVLMSSVARLRPLKLPDVHVMSLHHGPTADDSQLDFRDSAIALVREASNELRLHFHSEKSSEPLSSESEMREFRYTALSAKMKQLESNYGKPGLLLTAHHWNDQVETRLLRLIRGTGAQGFRAMSVDSGQILRPLLEIGRDELEAYAYRMGIQFLDDPSNRDANAMRNWIRNEWLPQLEKKQEGASRRLALSMERISEELSEKDSELNVHNGKISRLQFKKLTANQKSKLLVHYLRLSGVQDYGSGQVLELVKRLDTSRREHTFHLLKLEWRLNAEHIWVRPL